MTEVNGARVQRNWIPTVLGHNWHIRQSPSTGDTISRNEPVSGAIKLSVHLIKILNLRWDGDAIFARSPWMAPAWMPSTVKGVALSVVLHLDFCKGARAYLQSKFLYLSNICWCRWLSGKKIKIIPHLISIHSISDLGVHKRYGPHCAIHRPTANQTLALNRLARALL